MARGEAMKAVVGQIKCEDGYNVDKYGNPIEPGNNIPVEIDHDNVKMKKVMSAEFMPVDIVNGQFARERFGREAVRDWFTYIDDSGMMTVKPCGMPHTGSRMSKKGIGLGFDLM
jgi:hypothetical protein